MNISRRDKGQAMLRKRDQIKCLFTLALLNGLVRFLRPISNPPAFVRGFWARRKRWEKAEDPGDKFWRERWKQSKHGEKKIITFAPIIAFATLKAVSLKLNEILMMWKIQQAAGLVNWCHLHRQSSSRFHLGNRAKEFIWQDFQPAYQTYMYLCCIPLQYLKANRFQFSA